jgi:hypothetical protein
MHQLITFDLSSCCAVSVKSDPINGDDKFSLIKRIDLVIKILFLILSHYDISFIADEWIYVSDIPVDAFFGTLRNRSQCVPCYLTDYTGELLDFSVSCSVRFTVQFLR